MTGLKSIGQGGAGDALWAAARPSLRLVHDAKAERPAAAALRVIEQLSHRGPRPSLNPAEARRRYAESRKPLLARMETIESIIHVRPPIDQAPSMTVIRPFGQPAGDPLPAIVYFHGGGWTVGDIASYEPFCRQLANATGSTVIYVDYRLAPEHPFPAAFDDARRALRWVRENYAWLGVDPIRIGVGGDSSGGNLAAAVCLAERNDAVACLPAFQLLLYPALDMMACMPSHKELASGYLLTGELYGWYRQNYLGRFEKPRHWRLSPLFAHDVGGLPPAVILYAGFDPLRDEAAAYAGRLRDAGVATETLFFPDMIHGFLTMGGAIPTAGVAIARIAKLLDGLNLD
ncbi:MAG: alpha/beta hydrolase [Rhizomicrobium sp.]